MDKQVSAELQALLALVRSYPQGVKEFELLQKIYQSLPSVDRPNLSDTFVLFQQHFLLFHQLYRLRDQLHQADAGTLSIDALCIQWLPTGEAGTGLADKPDSLREYYLDLANLQNTGQDDVDSLLNGFWQRYTRSDVTDPERQAALQLFELPVDTNLTDIKNRYRQLLNQHHPDKGGAQEVAQDIIAAMAVLKRCYS